MKFTNNQIYNYASQLMRSFTDSSLRLPARINFYIQKNKQTIIALGEEIDRARSEILIHYGTADEQGMVHIPSDLIAQANQELQDLFDIEQEVNILKFSIEKFTDDISLSMEQMEAIMFMIEEA